MEHRGPRILAAAIRGTLNAACPWRATSAILNTEVPLPYRAQAFYPVSIKVDGEEIGLRIKRMNLEEWEEFWSNFERHAQPTIDRFAFRKDDEQSKDEKGEYVVPWAEVQKRRRLEMTDEERTLFEKAEEKDEHESREFYKNVFASFVRVERGLEEETDSGPVHIKEGLDFLRIFGARADVIGEVVNALIMENSLSDEKKRLWRSRTASKLSSDASAPAQAGPTQEPTAASAETEDSANGEDVSPRATSPSGSMGPRPIQSSSTNVR